MPVLFEHPSLTHQNQIDIQIVNRTTLAAIIIPTLHGATLSTTEEWASWAGGPPGQVGDFQATQEEEDLDGIWTDHFGIKILLYPLPLLRCLFFQIEKDQTYETKRPIDSQQD